MEAELKPKVLETFDLVATNYKKLRKLQDQEVERALRNDTLSSGQEKRYKVLKDEIVAEIKSLSLNTNRIESLVETLYDINKKLLGYRGAPAPPRRELWRQARGLPRRISDERARPQLAPPRRPPEEEGLGRFRARRARPDQGHPRRDP